MFFIAWAKAPFETFWQRAQTSTNWFQASVHYGYSGESDSSFKFPGFDGA
jgi:hypothetical protein